MESTEDRFSVSVVIVTFNTRAMTLDCLRVLATALEGISAEVIVVDNASTDDTARAIEAEHSEVRLVVNEHNAGFGAANNQAMRMAGGEFILLLNSDAFPEPEAIRKLLSYLREHPAVGVAGPRILNRDGSLQLSCFRFPSPAHAWMENLWLTRGYGNWAHDSDRSVDFVIGACLLVRREIVEKVGGFDEGFFMYSEEADWQKRIRDDGWDVAFVSSARVTHLGGASGASEKALMNQYFFQSLDRYERKHHGMAGLISLRCAMAVGCFLRGLMWSVVGLWPERRDIARSKMRLHFWLVCRQTLHWP